MTSEDEALILKKILTEIRFDKKMTDKSGKGFLLTTKFFKIANYAAILVTEKRNTEEKAFVQMVGTAVKKQENTTTKQIMTLKFTIKSSTRS